MITRGCTTKDFKNIAELLDRCASIDLDKQKEEDKFKDFEVGVKESKAVVQMRLDVQAFSSVSGILDSEVCVRMRTPCVDSRCSSL